MYQVFKTKYSAFYVEGNSPIVAEYFIRKNFTTEKIKYVGTFSSLSEIYLNIEGLFIDGVDNVTYKRFIETYGLVSIMRDYWDSFNKNKQK